MTSIPLVVTLCGKSLASKKEEFGPEPPTQPSESSSTSPHVSGMHKKRPDPVVTFHESMKRASRTTVKLRERAEKETLRGEWSEQEATTGEIETIAFTSTPRLVKQRGQLAGLPLDARAGFILGLVDGSTTVQTLIDVSGMTQQDVIAILQRLVSLDVIVLK